MTKYAEVKSDYTDDQNMTIIDAFKTDDGMEEGKQIAAVCRDTGKVVFFDSDETNNPQVREEIYNVLIELKNSGEVKNFKRRLYASIDYYKTNTLTPSV